MEEQRPVPQWTLDITVWHSAKFGHTVDAKVLTRHAGWTHVGHWRWKGLGVPEGLVQDLQTRVSAVITEHLVTRYGIQGELPTTWAGEPDLF